MTDVLSNKKTVDVVVIGAGIYIFGGIRVSGQAEVLDGVDRPIPGLFASGEVIGGLFFINYPLGRGLTRGAVFGKLARREHRNLSRQDQLLAGFT
jgi:succinate dehydrogenase/fumarate reductase flavoprotein subunit